MKRKALIIFTVLALLLTLTVATGGVATAASGSVDVVLIGGGVFNYTYGGELPISELSGSFNFVNMPFSDVSAANLAPYDTAVLNMASTTGSGGCACNSGNIPAQAKADIMDFVYNGGKLIIYDSECSPGPDYSWLIYPFSTNNPGAMGAPGVLTIVEENCLSSNDQQSMYYIDAPYLGPYTDAVGDMNVMVSNDSNWCIDMVGTNYNGVNGPVHTYARYGSGLMIYNGLDMDYVEYSPSSQGGLELIRMFELELLVAFDPVPACLPCGITVTGLSLSPKTATNCIDTDHTVTAHVYDINTMSDVEGATVVISVIAGPNTGETSGPMTTDVNGEASWTYTGSGGTGTDTIEVTGTDPAGAPLVSAQAEKTWEDCGGPGPQPIEVGGDVYPANKLMLLTPWITLGILLAAWGTFILRRHRSQS